MDEEEDIAAADDELLQLIENEDTSLEPPVDEEEDIAAADDESDIDYSTPKCFNTDSLSKEEVIVQISVVQD